MNEDLTTKELSWYERNQEQVKANRKTYYLKNKEKIRESCKTQYRKNKKERSIKERNCYRENREKFLDADKIYREKNKEKINEYLKLYRKNNKEKISDGAKASYQKHREKRLKSTQAYGQQPDVKLKINARIKQRRTLDPNFKLCLILRNQLYQHLKINKTKKSKSALHLVGCCISTLRKHIECQWLPGMSWDNYTQRGWHVDHIIPVNTFDLTKEEEQKKCFHYSNLRPLWAIDNLSRPKDGSDIVQLPQTNSICLIPSLVKPLSRKPSRNKQAVLPSLSSISWRLASAIISLHVGDTITSL